MKALLFGTLSTALIVADIVAAQVPAGGEFRINEATAFSQGIASVGVDPRGGFVVAWTDYGNPRAVKTRRFDAQGAPQSAEFRVNLRPANPARAAVVAVSGQGHALVAWSNLQDAGVEPGVFGRLVDASGAPAGAEFSISDASGGWVPDVAAIPGGFVVVWNAYAFDNYHAAIVGRRYDVAGNPIGSRFPVSAQTTGLRFWPFVAAAENGHFVVVWTDSSTNEINVIGQRFDASGLRLGAEFNGGPTYGESIDVASDGPGNFVVVRHSPASDEPAILGRRYDAAGVPVGAEFTVSTSLGPYSSYVSAASDRTGSFTVVWHTFPGDGSGSGVFGRRFTSEGVPRGAPFRVNSSTTFDQQKPDVATDGSGNVIAVWNSGHLSNAQQVFGQRFGGLVPAGMAAEDGGNRVVEVADDFTLVTSWRNVNGTDQTFQGRASDVVAPPGLVLTLSPQADYGTVPSGAVGDCTGACFAGSLTGTRPAGHVDLGFVEGVLPDAQGQTKRWRVHVGDSFGDVPRASPYYRFVETLLHHGVTAGCAAGAYCPASSATREQVAVYALMAKEGEGYAPPACGTPVFNDVPASSPFCRWIEELARRGVTSGCGDGNYCPTAAVAREQMAVFVLRTLDPTLDPPACGTPVFSDVPASSPYCRWIEELARRGIVTGCGGGNYCPSATVTREQMAVFISGTFSLTLYGP